MPFAPIGSLRRAMTFSFGTTPKQKEKVQTAPMLQPRTSPPVPPSTYLIQGDEPGTWSPATHNEEMYIQTLLRSRGSGRRIIPDGKSPVVPFQDHLGHPVQLTFCGVQNQSMIFVDCLTGKCRLVKQEEELRKMGKEHDGAPVIESMIRSNPVETSHSSYRGHWTLQPPPRAAE